MTSLRCVIVAGCATIFALTGISPVSAGMIHHSSQGSGSAGGMGAVSGAPKAPKKSRQQSKPPKQPKQQKSGKNGKGSVAGGGAGGAGAGGSGTTGSGGLLDPPDPGTLLDPPAIPDPPPDIGLPEFISLPGEETVGGDNFGSNLPLLLTGPPGSGSDPPLQFLDLSVPPDDSILSPLDVTGPELTDLDQPLHNPEPSSMLLALLGGGCTIFSRLHRRSRRREQLPGPI